MSRGRRVTAGPDRDPLPSVPRPARPDGGGWPPCGQPAAADYFAHFLHMFCLCFWYTLVFLVYILYNLCTLGCDIIVRIT